MKNRLFFVQCTNRECLLRFPLDLSQFKGSYCPRCGAPLDQDCAALVQSKLPADLLAARHRLVGVLDNIRSIHNVGSIFRTADGAGLEELHLCGITPTPEDHPNLAKTALGSQLGTPWQYHPNTPALVKQLQTEGTLILALEVTATSQVLFESSFPATPGLSVALVVGNEPAGIDPQVLKLADATLSLPMLGDKGSLNVSVAFGIAAYWLQFARNSP
ncbi:MAG: RNA methyltransferase [Anaerolineaceae bacterium]